MTISLEKSDIVPDPAVFRTHDECWVPHSQPEAVICARSFGFNILTLLVQNAYSGNNPYLLQSAPRLCWSAVKAVVLFFFKIHCVLLIMFKRSTPSMKNTVPNFWGNYERLSRPKAQKKFDKGVLFKQSNVQEHKSLVSTIAVCDCGFELVDHPPYPPDYHLFPNI